MNKMGMLLRSFLNRSSRYVVHKDESDSEHERFESDDDQYCCTKADMWTSLTVWRKSLVFSCNGFTVIDSKGDLVYRVDNYMSTRPEEIVLMDGSGHSILTLARHKKMKLLQSWYIYKGERSGTESIKKPMYTVKRQMSVKGTSTSSNTKMLANVYFGASDQKQHIAYKIIGSYSNRSCKILEGSKKMNKVVAEIKRKEVTMKNGEGVSFGMEVFVLTVEPEFDRGVAMGLVLLLDQMFS